MLLPRESKNSTADYSGRVNAMVQPHSATNQLTRGKTETVMGQLSIKPVMNCS